MTETDLPDAIRTFISATNDADPDAFVAAFTDDAHLTDWGREFKGHTGVRAWDRTDNIGVHSHFEFVTGERGQSPDSYVVTLTVSGDGFNGTGPMHFTLRSDRIASVLIG